jgi:hypothetical protein
MAATGASNNNNLVVILAVALIAIVAVAAVYLMQDHRGPAERAGDAVAALPNGLNKAASKLDDQPPAQNVKRNLDNAADDVTNHK